MRGDDYAALPGKGFARLAIVGGTAALLVAGAGLGYLGGTRAGRRPPAEIATGVASRQGPDRPEIDRRKLELALTGAAVVAGAAAAVPAAATPASDEGPAVTALEERNQYVQRLEASGPDRHRLLDKARAASEVWSGVAQRSNAGVTVGPWSCHGAGCFSTMLHASPGTIDDFTNEITRTDEFRGWVGAKIRSGPIERPDGKTEVTWFLLAPEPEKNLTGPLAD
jgi:hypothetical protein